MAVRQVGSRGDGKGATTEDFEYQRAIWAGWEATSACRKIAAMNTHTKLVTLCPGDVLPVEIVVSLLIGLADYHETYPEQSLQGFLKAKRTAATEELVKCQIAINAAADAETDRLETSRLHEIQVRLLRLESQIADARRYHQDIVTECAKGSASELKFDEEVEANAGELLFPLASVEWWVRKKYSRSLVAPGEVVSLERPVTVASNPDEKPWNVQDPNDPDPQQPWYTPARYFARQLVTNDTALLTKRNILCDKVAASLKGVGINKRGGKLPFSTGTVKKALANVRLG